MPASTPFPTPWGYDKIIGNNQTNILGASLDVWRDSATQNLAADLTWGMIPIILVTAIYIRTKRLDVGLAAGLLATYGLKGLSLISRFTSTTMFIGLSLGLALTLTYTWFNKN